MIIILKKKNEQGIVGKSVPSGIGLKNNTNTAKGALIVTTPVMACFNPCKISLAHNFNILEGHTS